MGARGVSLEHVENMENMEKMENMEMFSGAPTEPEPENLIQLWFFKLISMVQKSVMSSESLPV